MRRGSRTRRTTEGADGRCHPRRSPAFPDVKISDIKASDCATGLFRGFLQGLRRWNFELKTWTSTRSRPAAFSMPITGLRQHAHQDRRRSGSRSKRLPQRHRPLKRDRRIFLRTCERLRYLSMLCPVALVSSFQTSPSRYPAWNNCSRSPLLWSTPFVFGLWRHVIHYGVRILGYCLMPNHVHLIAIPERENSLARALAAPTPSMPWR